MAASLEQKKRQYSNQLAAHTLRQWNAIKKEPDSQRTPSEQEKNSNVRNGNNSNVHDRGSSPETTQPNRKGLQVVDFVTRRSPERAP